MARTQYGTGHMTPDAIKRHVDRFIRLYGGVDAMKKVHSGRMLLDELLEAQDREQTTMDKESYDAMQREFRRRVLSNAACNAKFHVGQRVKLTDRGALWRGKHLKDVVGTIEKLYDFGEASDLFIVPSYWIGGELGRELAKMPYLEGSKDVSRRVDERDLVAANSYDLKSRVAQNAVAKNARYEIDPEHLGSDATMRDAERLAKWLTRHGYDTKAVSVARRGGADGIPNDVWYRGMGEISNS